MHGRLGEGVGQDEHDRHGQGADDPGEPQRVAADVGHREPGRRGDAGPQSPARRVADAPDQRGSRQGQTDRPDDPGQEVAVAPSDRTDQQRYDRQRWSRRRSAAARSGRASWTGCGVRCATRRPPRWPACARCATRRSGPTPARRGRRSRTVASAGSGLNVSGRASGSTPRSTSSPPELSGQQIAEAHSGNDRHGRDDRWPGRRRAGGSAWESRRPPASGPVRGAGRRSTRPARSPSTNPMISRMIPAERTGRAGSAGSGRRPRRGTAMSPRSAPVETIRSAAVRWRRRAWP